MRSLLFKIEYSLVISMHCRFIASIVCYNNYTQLTKEEEENTSGDKCKQGVSPADVLKVSINHVTLVMPPRAL